MRRRHGVCMLFSSLIFLYAFLPGTLLLYFLVPRKCKNFILLLASLTFYAWGEPKYLLLILLSILLGYGTGLGIHRFRGRFWSRLFLLASVSGSLGLLAWFKYADFAISTVNQVFGTALPLWRLALPVGISFYTFQILSYTIDLYRGDVAVQRNPLSFAVYVVLFPQLIAGPIVRYRDVALALQSRKHSVDTAYEGAARFLVGLGKKVILANNLGILCQSYRSSTQSSVLFAWLYAVGFFLQIYFDFSGYSDMAIGLGKMFGFHFPENFRYPYCAKSVTEFWRRWHITLGTWFRDYVYIPLGGNRVSRLRWVCNICLVWCLTGLWHGAGWNFLLWGLFYALLLLGEKLWYGAFLQRNPGIGHFYLLLSVVLGFVLFNAETLAQAFQDFKTMFGGSSLPFFSKESLYALRTNGVLLLFSILGATPLPARLYGRGKKVFQWMEPVLLALLLFICTAYLVDGSFNPFLYFRF